MYIGEVGDTGEVAAGQIVVSSRPVNQIPTPALLPGLVALGLGGLRKGRAEVEDQSLTEA